VRSGRAWDILCRDAHSTVQSPSVFPKKERNRICNYSIIGRIVRNLCSLWARAKSFFAHKLKNLSVNRKRSFLPQNGKKYHRLSLRVCGIFWGSYWSFYRRLNVLELTRGQFQNDDIAIILGIWNLLARQGILIVVVVVVVVCCSNIIISSECEVFVMMKRKNNCVHSLDRFSYLLLLLLRLRAKIVSDVHYLDTFLVVRYNRTDPFCYILTLGSWVRTQRQRAKSKTINSDQVNRLNAIGFEWVLKQRTWDEYYELLLQYIKENGHANVPQIHIQTRSKTWVMGQNAASAC